MMSLKRRFSIAIAILSGIFNLLNSWSLFQQSSFYFSAACYLLAFGSLTPLGSLFSIFYESHEKYFGTLILIVSTLGFLTVASLKSSHLLAPALIAFYLGSIGGILLATLR